MKSRDVQARSGDSPPQLPFPVRGRCAGILSSLLSCGEGTGVVPESASRPEKKAKHCLHREMVVCIQCHPRPCSLLQCCSCVCLDRLGRLKSGREYGARESKSQEAPAFPQLIFPDANEALLRKQPCSAVRPKPKATVKARHLLRIQSRNCGLLLVA